MRVIILLYMPAQPDAAWSDSDIVTLAGAIDGAEIVRDEEGGLAAQFGARTSGHVLGATPQRASCAVSASPRRSSR
ncbi:MAG: hypothetical protein SGJ11_02240 [Phycisphaerae bacterium]|nr:hypothetical protein [Phycisphaerae bacterium]